MSREYTPYFEVKDVNEDGTFTGVASVYGVEDLGGDIIDKGALKKTISDNPEGFLILWQHDADEVIGKGIVKEWQGKILIDGKLDMEDPTAMKAYRKMKARLIKGLSIGFNTIKSSWEEVEGRMVRHITELKLWEVSVVTFPMLPEAQITRVKSAEEDARIAQIVATEVSKQVQEQVQALQAKQVATEPVSAGAGEGAAVTSTEPVVDHSALISQLDQLKGALQWKMNS